MTRTTHNRDAAGAAHAAEAPSVFRRLQHTLPFRISLGGFVLSARLLPVWFLRLAGLPVAVLFALFNRSNFEAIRCNLRRVLPGLSPGSSAVLACHVFRNYANYLIDLMSIGTRPERLRTYSITMKGREHLDRALESGKGVVLLTSHLGNWEIGGPLFDMADKKLHLVYSPDSSGILETQRRRIRGASGIVEVPLEGGGFASIRLLNILRDGGVVALQGDRLAFDSGIAMPFFGAEALFPRGPVTLALVSDSILLPVFMPMTGYKSYEIVVGEPILPQREGDRTEEIRTNLLRIITILEQQIIRYPTQWFAFTPFWEEDKKRGNE